MAANKSQIRKWIDNGIKTRATHVIIVYDRWDYEDFPVYVNKDQSVEKVIESYNGKNMNSVMEVYNLSIDIEVQLNEFRSWNL